MKIAKDGLPFISGFGILGICLWFLSVPLGVISWVLAGFCLYFFRDPNRIVPKDNVMVLSPADGKVMEITEENDKKIIRIFLSIFNVHIQRSPFSGTIKSIEYKPGKFLPAMSKNACIVNEQNIFTIDTVYGEIEIRQIAGIIARRVVAWVKPGEAIEAGQRIGIIKFGSQVDICLPAKAEILVKASEKVKGGNSIIACMNNPPCSGTGNYSNV
ncbi:MAG: phosphatidylserine decarboxylase [Elusimicrobia bacterium RIFOXYA2_FULL_40_6]|nr:MAG: phosphatidylserine decarboxylase [Elusimicrobia bacterium RIFOXYA2_FULL_40_6]